MLDVRVRRWSDEAVPPDCVRVVEANQAGIFVGTIVTVLTFAVLTPNAEVLGTDGGSTSLQTANQGGFRFKNLFQNSAER